MATKKKGTPLVSARYAAMYLPNTSWDFFDAFTSSEQCKTAFNHDDISTKGKNVKKYLRLTAAERLRMYRESQRASVQLPPQHILELLKLQHDNGKFLHLKEVLSCLFMPPSITFRNDDMFVEWEKATAFAVAAMRQQNEFFDHLCEAHDKAFAWMESNEILFEARELINEFQFTGIETEAPVENAHSSPEHPPVPSSLSSSSSPSPHKNIASGAADPALSAPVVSSSPSPSPLPVAAYSSSSPLTGTRTGTRSTPGMGKRKQPEKGSARNQPHENKNMTNPDASATGFGASASGSAIGLSTAALAKSYQQTSISNPREANDKNRSYSGTKNSGKVTSSSTSSTSSDISSLQTLSPSHPPPTSPSAARPSTVGASSALQLTGLLPTIEEVTKIALPPFFFA
jgi:hypothetical protein